MVFGYSIATEIGNVADRTREGGVMRCPHCGMPIKVVDIVTLTDRQEAIRAAVEYLLRNTDKQNGHDVKTVSSDTIRARLEVLQDTGELPDEMAMGRSTVATELKTLEEQKILCRPEGPRSGYALKGDYLRVVRAAA